MQSSQRVLAAVLASLVVHGWAALALPATAPAAHSGPQPAAAAQSVPFEAIEVPTVSHSDRRLLPEPPTPGGPISASNLDSAQPGGRGGSGAAPEPGVLLFPFASELTLQDSDPNHLGVSQTQRLRTDRTRATLEERRASPRAQDAFFLASGETGHQERRPPATADARGGAWTPKPGARPGSSNPELGSQASPLGSRDPSTAQGIDRGRGVAQAAAARVDFGRPNVDRGPAATPAVERDPQVSDTQNAELLAARFTRSWVDASVQQSLARGPGSGGPREQTSGLQDHGAERGARALPYLPGPGRLDVLDTRDARYLRWFTSQRARVQAGLVFPEARALSRDQGTSLFRVEVSRDGSLKGSPRLLRSSGFSDFDAAAVVAIERAAPFEPLPPALSDEREQLSVVIPVAFDNPMIE